MQTASPTLTAAIAAPEQQPAKAVQIDWNGDGYGPQGQIITNPDMESTDLSAWLAYVPSGSYTQAAGIVSAISGQVVGSVTAPAPHAGTRLMAVTWPQNAGAAGSMVGQRLATTVGQQYQAVAWVQVPVGSQPVKARAQGAADSAASSGTGSWQQLTVTFTATKPSTIVGVVLPQATTTTTYYVFVDDFTVTPIAPPDYDTVTEQVSGITIDRTFSSDLPDAVLHPSGYTSAELTLTLADGPSGPSGPVSAPAAHSPYNATSPLYGRRPLARPVTVDLGMRTSAGVEVLRQFTGRTRSRSGQPGEDVEIKALDLAELMRGQATIPLVVGDDGIQWVSGGGGPDPVKPGLNSQWLIEYLFRRVGYSLSPPARPGCALSVPCHGSMWPEIGSILGAYRTVIAAPGVIADRVRVPYAAGKFGLAPTTRPDGNYEVFADGLMGLTTCDTNNGSKIVFEGWVKAPPAGRTWRDGYYLMATSTSGNPLAELVLSTVSGNLTATIQRSASIVVTATGPAMPLDGNWHYVGCLMEFFGSLTNVWFRLDSTSYAVIPLSHAAAPTVGPQDEWVMYPNADQVEGWQVWPTTTSSPTWNDTWTPNCIIDAGLNELYLMPDDARTGAIWDLLGAISEAEFGYVSWTEAGVPVWRNASWWSSAGQTAVVATVTSQDALLAARVEEAVDAVRNRVTASTARPTMTAATVIWTADQVYTLPAGQTVTIVADLGDSYAGVDGPIIPLISPTEPLGVSWMFATTSPDGSGITVNIGVTAKATVIGNTATITITNSTGQALYTAHPFGLVTGTPGAPAINLVGLKVDWGNPASSHVDVSNAASSGVYGEQVYPLADSQLRQNPDAIQVLAVNLLGWLRRPRPAVTGVEIVADPRLQLGDRIALKDLDTGTVLGEEYWVVGIHTNLDDQGMTQHLDLRQATSPGGWVLGRTSPVNRTRLGVSTHLADL